MGCLSGGCKSMSAVFAIDVGGTKLATAIVSDEGQILAQDKRLVERSNAAALAQQIADAAASLDIRKHGVTSAGAIVPGIYFAASGNVWVPNLWGHAEVPFRKELEHALGMPVHVDSDRAGYVLGEQWLGAARGAGDVVYLAVGTGIGAGIISGGRLLRGADDIAGAVGWFALKTESSEMYRRCGCWESEASGPALARRANAVSAEEVIAAARKGDTRAIAAIAETGRYLGLGIANIVSLLNPELIVLGGGLLQAYDLFAEPIQKTVFEWAQPVAAQKVRLTPSQLGENAGLFGAARLALEDF
jgi:glucokinase